MGLMLTGPSWTCELQGLLPRISFQSLLLSLKLGNLVRPRVAGSKLNDFSGKLPGDVVPAQVPTLLGPIMLKDPSEKDGIGAVFSRRELREITRCFSMLLSRACRSFGDISKPSSLDSDSLFLYPCS